MIRDPGSASPNENQDPQPSPKYERIGGYITRPPLDDTEIPLDMTVRRKDSDGQSPPAERRDVPMHLNVRPSVITKAPPPPIKKRISSMHSNGEIVMKSVVNAESPVNCDVSIEEHFRRSLGSTYSSIYGSSTNPQQQQQQHHQQPIQGNLQSQQQQQQTSNNNNNNNIDTQKLMLVTESSNSNSSSSTTSNIINTSGNGSNSNSSSSNSSSNSTSSSRSTNSSSSSTTNSTVVLLPLEAGPAAGGTPGMRNHSSSSISSGSGSLSGSPSSSNLSPLAAVGSTLDAIELKQRAGSDPPLPPSTTTVLPSTPSPVASAGTPPTPPFLSVQPKRPESEEEVDDHFAKALGDTWKKIQENKMNL